MTLFVTTAVLLRQQHSITDGFTLPHDLILCHTVRQIQAEWFVCMFANPV